MADHTTPDYSLERELALDGEQMRTLLEPTRTAIIELLGERAATTSELADALGKPKGTVGHPCKALEAAGLITVVRTKQVRAIEAKYYGRTARTFVLHNNDDVDFGGETMLAEAAAELTRLRQSEPEAELAGITSLRYARIPDERAAEWARRLGDLVDEFTQEPRGGERVYGFAVSLFPTLKPTLDGVRP